LAPDASVSVWLIVRYDPLCYFFLVAAPSHFAHLLKLSKALLIKLFDKFSLLYLGNPDFCYSIRFNNQVFKKKYKVLKPKTMPAVLDQSPMCSIYFFLPYRLNQPKQLAY